MIHSSADLRDLQNFLHRVIQKQMQAIQFEWSDKQLISVIKGIKHGY